MFKSGAWRVAPFIFGVVMLENMASLTVGVNLFTYAFNKMHFSLTTSANIVTNYMGTNFLLSLAGGIVSDLWLTRFASIIISAVIEITGLLLMTISASCLTPPEGEEATAVDKAVLFLGLYLLAIGSGTIKANLAPLGAMHFAETDPEEKRELGNYFNAYFLSFSLGSLGAFTVMVYTLEKASFKLGYCLALVLMVVALLVFLAGYSVYGKEDVRGRASPVLSFLQVVVAAFRNRNRTPVPPEILHHINEGSNYALKHTSQFKFMDKAATPKDDAESGTEQSAWRICSVTQVEEVKIMLRIIPVFATTIVINCMVAQVQTLSVQQGRTMDRRIVKDFEIPPASLAALPIAFLVLMLPVYDQLLVPLSRRLTGLENGITHLQKIGVGLLLATLSMLVAVLVEKKRMRTAARHGLLDDPSATVPLKIYWITLQYLVLGVADMLTFVGLMEFFYSESPARLRSIATSLAFVSLSLGYFLSSALVSVVQRVTSGHGRLGWLPDNINRGKLTSFYYLLTIISLANLACFLVCAKWYKYKTHY